MKKANREIVIFGVALTIIALFFIFNSFLTEKKQLENTITEPYRAELTGVQVCLPPKDTDREVTLECVIGFKTDTGEYYALDFDLSSHTSPDISNGKRFSASGVVTPIERLSTDQWQKYDVEGIFSVTDSVVFLDDNDEPLNVTPKPTVSAKCYVGGCSAQICSDEPDAMSDCMFRPEYACYKDAMCEQQASGLCGWTETPELVACLDSPEQ